MVRVEPKKSRLIPRKVWPAVVLVVLGVLLAAQNSTVVFPQMDSYAVVNQRTITVKVGVAPCSWTRVTNVAEAPTEVRVKVETLPCPRPGPGTAELALQDLTVSLAADLGARVVEDANGQAIPLRTSESTSPAPGEYALPTFQATLNGVPGACAGVSYDVGTVTIHGSAADPALSWIMFEPAGRREDLLWPADYRARFDPGLKVIDPSGRVVAREGDRVTGGCGMPPGGTLISLPTVTTNPTPPG